MFPYICRSGSVVFNTRPITFYAAITFERQFKKHLLNEQNK